MAEPDAAERPAANGGGFERETAVWRESGDERSVVFGAEVAPGWRAGRGPHGGYLAAMLVRALIATVAEPAREPRSLTIHYARAPAEGPVRIETTLERQGRSLSTLSARMLQDDKLIALVLAAFSVPWDGPEVNEVAMPEVDPPAPREQSTAFLSEGAPAFTEHLLIQPRLGAAPFSGGEQPMEITGWLGLTERRPVDAPFLAFLSDALIPAPFMRTAEPVAAPTIDLSVHFRVPSPTREMVGEHELCLVRTQTRMIHDGFFEEDGSIWAADGTLLAQSRQLAILMPFS